jgi:regulatory protein
VTTAERAADPQARLQHALDLSYRFLGHRDRTVAEIRRHLEHKRVEPATIDEAVAVLTDQGYLDDARFAERFAADRRTLDGWGPDRIERKLAAAGVAAAYIDVAIAARDERDELAAALAVLRRRFPAPPSGDRERGRALGFLVRKGYGLELAHDAIRTLERGE